MNKNTLLLSANEVYERLKCQNHVPNKVLDDLTQVTKEYVNNDMHLETEILHSFKKIIDALYLDQPYLKTDNDKMHYEHIYNTTWSLLNSIPIITDDDRL